MTALDVIWVGIGGGAGSILRWQVGIWITDRYKSSFPISTFFLNISGAFVIAYLSVLFSVDWQNRFGEPLNALMLTGFLGGYTTFSSMQLDALKLVENGKKALALFYLVSSTCAGLIAALAGVWLALHAG